MPFFTLALGVSFSWICPMVTAAAMETTSWGRFYETVLSEIYG
jgi:hypothetical protein